MTDLVSETRNAFAPWHPVDGFDFNSIRRTANMIHPARRDGNNGYRVVPVTITITATGTGDCAAPMFPAATGV